MTSKKALHISRFGLHALQKTKRVKRADGDQFEAHHMCFTQRQLFEHFVSDGRIGDVDDERHALLSPVASTTARSCHRGRDRQFPELPPVGQQTPAIVQNRD